MAFLEVKNVKKSFHGKNREEVTALADISFSCESGEFLCVVGPTGCGKTTLLRLIAGLEKSTSGEITVDGKPVNGINRDAALVFQQYALFPWRNVIDNIAFGLEMKNVGKMARYEHAIKFVELVGLTGFERAYPYELSGGMQQRVAIARALAYDPKLLLLDEPFGALDERTRQLLQEELLSIWRHSKKTVVFVTHNIDEAIFLSDRILIMRDQPGDIEEIIEIGFSRPRDRRSKEFIELHIRTREILERILYEKT